ncbi:MAG: ABC transporter substrate-binding protein [Sphaerochaetaceae bacterium]|nr:ABC transporter substrate-binding protein [Sphaerochaetaceae bacterium]MDC7242571.1 ABC transporter substrate-binding protein [Sphaerochaetaceae bacterium]MDC7250056.1 ABC transporter substrate-binding protein [Sphaerochaetaceae bacterium]
MKNRVIITISLVVALFSVSCSKEEVKALNIGLMPAVDIAPIMLAEKNGYFEEIGLEVNLQIFTNAQNRQTALQTNEIDGAMTDIVALITNNAEGFGLKGVVSTDGMFPLLVNPKHVDDKDISVGMMEISVSNYLVEQYLGDEYTYDKVYINEIPTRLEAIATGDTERGLIPEPVASIGEMNGLIKVVYDGIPSESLDIMAFTDKAISEKEKSIELFTQAYEKAVSDIQKDPSLARDVLMETITTLPPQVRESITLPEYKDATLPSDAFINELIEWTNKIVDENYDITPDDILDRRFVK